MSEVPSIRGIHGRRVSPLIMENDERRVKVVLFHHFDPTKLFLPFCTQQKHRTADFPVDTQNTVHKLTTGPHCRAGRSTEFKNNITRVCPDPFEIVLSVACSCTLKLVQSVIVPTVNYWHLSLFPDPSMLHSCSLLFVHRGFYT